MERINRIKSHLTGGSSSSITLEPVNQSSLIQSNHQYTLSNEILSKEQRDLYEKNGFLVIKRLIPEDRLKQYAERFEFVVKNPEERSPGLVVMRDVIYAKKMNVSPDKAINKLQDFQEDPVLFNYCSSPEILHYLPAFVGENIMAMHTMLINKPPDPGTETSRHPMHQDLHYFPFRPADKIVCSWTAMQKVTRDNGCLAVIPGSHKGELLKHTYPDWKKGVNKMYHGIDDFDPKWPRSFLEMQPGDTVFFHPLLIHGSGTNRTKGFRKAISCHYASSECEYIDVEGTVQENIAEEVFEVVRKRYKRIGKEEELSGFKYKDIWKFRARLVAGDAIHL